MYIPKEIFSGWNGDELRWEGFIYILSFKLYSGVINVLDLSGDV